MAYARAMNKGTAVVLLVLGGLLVLGAGAMVFTSTSTGGTSCGSVMSPSTEDIGPYDFGAEGACEAARRARITYATMLGVSGLACLAFGGWLLNDSGPAAEPQPEPGPTTSF